MSFEVPYIDTPAQLPTEKEATEKAFYTASASTNDPIGDFHQVKADLMNTGDSDLMNNVQRQWEQEQDQGNKQAVEGIITDQNLPTHIKKAVLENYRSTGYVQKGLRDRYIDKTAINDAFSNTVDQKAHQDWVVDNLNARRSIMDVEQRKSDISSNIGTMRSLLNGAQHMYQGAGNTLGLVSDEEYKQGYKAYKASAASNPIATGVGAGVGIITGALAGITAAGPAGAIAVGGALAGGSRFAELGVDGANPEDRMQAAFASAGMTSAEIALPIFRAATLVKAMVLNGAGNVALGELDTSIQNTILKAYPELQQAQFDPKHMTVNAIFGALLGAAFGTKSTPKINNVPPNTGASPSQQGAASPSPKLLAAPKPEQIADKSNETRFTDTMFASPNGEVGTKFQRAEADAKMTPEERASKTLNDLGIEQVRKNTELKEQANRLDNQAAIVRAQGKKALDPAGHFLTRANDLNKQAQALRAQVVPVPEREIPKEENLSLNMIDPGSPADVTKTVNPTVAENVGAAAIMDQTGKFAQAMGTNRGSLVNDWVLPKLLDSDTIRANPSLSNRLNQLDVDMEHLFNDFRYDPNIVSATKRDQDASNLYDVVKSVRGGVYQEANSIINFSSAGQSSGKMVFGPDSSTQFINLQDAYKLKNEIQDYVNKLPEGERGIVTLGNAKGHGYQVEWHWKKQYDDFAMRAFGIDSVQPTILGVDSSALARSSLGNFIFSHGRFPQEVEFGAMRSVERAARLEGAFMKALQDNIARSKFGPELDHLINTAEERGIESFSKKEIGGMFPHLSQRNVSELFDSHTAWRKIQHYVYNFANRELRKSLTDNEMQGIYKGGDYVGAGTTKITADELRDIKTVWDFEKGSVAQFDPKKITESGKVLVRLASKIEEPGMIHNYGLIGGDTQLNMLPVHVLPQIPGYSPRVVKEYHFVDKTPKSLIVDGKKVTDPAELRKYSKSVAAAKDKAEADKLAVQATADNPDHVITVRPERQDSFGKVVSEYQVHGEMYQQAQRRGERLPSLHGPARIEDRLPTLVKTIQKLSRVAAFRDWEDNFRTTFTNSFPEFLHGEFPQYKTDIKPLENMTKEEGAKFDIANRMFEYYSNMKSFETLGDHLWKRALYSIADISEKYKLPHEVLREVGKKGNLPVQTLKSLTTAFYIHMNPVRQWIIQPAQLMEMYALNGRNAPRMFQDMMAIRMAIASHNTLEPAFNKISYALARNGSTMHPDEFDATFKAIVDSGLIQGIDTNVLVHGLFKEVDRNLVETKPAEVTRDIEQLVKALPRAARAVGFDLAELTNRIGLYLQAKAIWQENNPGKNWNTKENREVIAAEGLRLSGVMNQAATLPYQRGTMSTFMQFVAINQKLFMNLVQGSATSMSGADRAKLAAIRFVLYGGLAGIPGGGIVYALLNEYGDEEVRDNAELVKRGVVDYVGNHLLATIVDPNTPSDIAFSKGLSPYSENFLPYFDTLGEIVKLFNDNPSDNPRFPGFTLAGNIGKTVGQMNSWFHKKEVNEQTFKQIAIEAAELAPGFNNYIQGLTMLGIQDKVTSNGNKMGMQYSAAEAYSKMAGFQAYKDLNTWEMIAIKSDKARMIDETAKQIHKDLMNLRNKEGNEGLEEYGRRLSSMISILPEKHFGADDRVNLIKKVLDLDRKSQVDIQTSILGQLWKNNSEEGVHANERLLEILGRQKDPRAQEIAKALKEGKL